MDGMAGNIFQVLPPNAEKSYSWAAVAFVKEKSSFLTKQL
jgi:hypothetical protein